MNNFEIIVSGQGYDIWARNRCIEILALDETALDGRFLGCSFEYHVDYGFNETGRNLPFWMKTIIAEFANKYCK